MPSDRKFYRSVFQIVVLSQERYAAVDDLSEVAYSITQGDCNGVVTTLVENQEVDAVTAAQILVDSGSDPEFFGLTAEGEEHSYQRGDRVLGGPNFVVYGAHYWGSGDDLTEAKRNFRRQGGRLSDGYAILEFGEDSEFQGVDEMGRYFYRGQSPTERVVKPKGRTDG